MCPICINNISEHISSPLRLFADNYLLYRLIHTETDAQQLQHGLLILIALLIKLPGH